MRKRGAAPAKGRGPAFVLGFSGWGDRYFACVTA